jgi:dTDP-4-amino-4,6-dideoxygalactose transaminase
MDKVLKKLRELTRHERVKILNSGNAAIFAAAYIISRSCEKKVVLAPDQGGWMSYSTYPLIFGLKVKEIKTDKGIIDLRDLEDNAKDAGALFVTSFAGYYAEQPMKEISRICRKNNCLLIEDASGSIGDKILCNGEYSDIIVASFGKWKAADLGSGGFISSNSKDYLEDSREIFSFMKFNGDYNAMLSKLENIEERLSFLFKTAEKVKKELEKDGFNILHRNKRGLNVVAAFKNEKEKEKLISYCRNNHYEFVVCPKNIRVEERAISIEIKRMVE